MIIVIADDITGAAEIAGIAKSAGLNTRLLMTGNGSKFSDKHDVYDNKKTDILVFATDTRQMMKQDAVDEVIRIAENLPKDVRIFKKTDSVLRGHILAECQAIMRHSEYEKLLLVPQNPSKGRVVRGGMYYINNVPLNETQFANDPEFPAKSADVTPFGVPDADCQEDIVSLLEATDEKTLLAGGADLFSAMISSSVSTDKHYSNSNPTKPMEDEGAVTVSDSKISAKDSDDARKLILVCGSTQSTKVAETPLCRRFDAVECNMPADVFYGKYQTFTESKSPVEAWKKELCSTFSDHGIVLTINYPAQGGKDFAIRLRKTMADVVRSLTESVTKSSFSGKLFLIIEGGATAFEVLNTLGWNSFEVVKEHFPGVVEIANNQANIILKPGSYPWGNMLG